jgi:hypothetical protein
MRAIVRGIRCASLLFCTLVFAVAAGKVSHTPNGHALAIALFLLAVVAANYAGLALTDKRR